MRARGVPAKARLTLMVLRVLKFAATRSALSVEAVDKCYSAASPVAQPALNAESLTTGVVLDEEDEEDDAQ